MENNDKQNNGNCVQSSAAAKAECCGQTGVTATQQPSEMNNEKETLRQTDEMYMRRCLQLAANGMRRAKPNPMVGAVIVARGRLIGEGYHVRCGEGHAEVNAFASVKECDAPLLAEATIYVSLEPCSHYGKTPPCADLIISKGVRRAVVGCIDPFAKVQGRGIKKLRDAGIEVTVGVLEAECRELNRRFITSNERHRPYVILKWAQTADGFLDDHGHATAISTPFTQMLVHKLRSECDAIAVGRTTDEREHPRLDVRHWTGDAPRRIVIDSTRPAFEGLDFTRPVVPQLLGWLHAEGCQSLLVEGGAATLASFIASGEWDEIRVEESCTTTGGGTRAPKLPDGTRVEWRKVYDGNVTTLYRRV